MAAPKKVLIVDDEFSILELFSYALRTDGYEVQTAEDGQDGLAKAAEFKPDIIILDLMMPRLSGFDVIHKLQETDLRSVPVIVVTGYSDQANSEISHEPNVSEIMSKPVRPSELKAAIKRTLEKT